ncbi:uncharacterized protein [Drosophila takahashii]|uniref:uncharacterized protein n=1 Tax=Drosophila takahashii TaxID=29030 RepID=UPI00389937B3
MDEFQDTQDLFNHQRQKRGALDLVGNLANGLFGVLDSQYAQKIETTLQKIKSKELDHTHLLEKQTSILDSQVNVMKSSYTMMVTNLENSIKTGKVAQIATELSLVAGHIKRTQAMIINVVTGVHKGTIDPALLSVQELDELLVFHSKVPLVDEEEFNVYHLSPIPIVVNNTIRIVRTETDYLAISDHQDRHFAISKGELEGCTRLSTGSLLCKLRQATLGPAHELLRCTLAAFHKEHDPLCASTEEPASSIWYPLTLPNSWIFATAKEITLTYVCGEERHQVHIDGSGKITLKENCIARSATVTLQGHPHLQSAIHEQEPAIFVHPMSLRNKPGAIMEHDMESRYGTHTQQLKQLQQEVQTLRKMQTQQPNESTDGLQRTHRLQWAHSTYAVECRSSHVVAREIIQQGPRFPDGEGARDPHNINYHTATNV